MERIWRDYQGTERVQALALDFWNGSAGSVQGFIDATGFTFPVLRNAGYLQTNAPPVGYQIAYDNYVVVDAEGVVRYTSVAETFTSLGRFNDARLRAEIDRLLLLDVEASTWTSVKGLYR